MIAPKATHRNPFHSISRTVSYLIAQVVCKSNRNVSNVIMRLPGRSVRIHGNKQAATSDKPVTASLRVIVEPPKQALRLIQDNRSGHKVDQAPMQAQTHTPDCLLAHQSGVHLVSACTKRAAVSDVTEDATPPAAKPQDLASIHMTYPLLSCGFRVAAQNGTRRDVSTRA